MENSLFLSLLPPEKAEAIRRGESVEITGEEAATFQARMELARPDPCPQPCLFRPE